jgi:hypothetical protein
MISCSGSERPRRDREDKDESVEEWRFEERMNVADTEVISRTERQSIVSWSWNEFTRWEGLNEYLI